MHGHALSPVTSVEDQEAVEATITLLALNDSTMLPAIDLLCVYVREAAELRTAPV